MICLKIRSCVLLLTLIFTSSVFAMDHARRHHHHHSDELSVGKTIVGVGLLAAAGYGLYTFFDWLFTKTDEQVLKEAKKSFTTAFDATKSGVVLIQEGVGEFPVSAREQQRVIKDCAEDFLYHSAVSGLHSYAHSFEQHAREIGNALAMVQNRIAKIKKKNLVCPVLAKLEGVAVDLETLQTELNFCAAFMSAHESYYRLFELESKLMGWYAYELDSVDHHAHNTPYLREALRMGVMKKAAGSRDSYPFMAFVQSIEHDINKLEHAVSALSYRYENRRKGSARLLEKLSMIHTIVISEDAYRQELRDHKKEMLERERIAAEQAKAQAAAAQAHAAHLQAIAMQQQAQALHEQNHILATQRPTRVNVYL